MVTEFEVWGTDGLSKSSLYIPALGSPSHIDSGLGHVICFGQWDISKHDKSWDSIITCPELWGLASSTTALRSPCCEEAQVSHMEMEHGTHPGWLRQLTPLSVSPPAKGSHMSEPKQTCRKTAGPAASQNGEESYILFPATKCLNGLL